VGTVNVPIAAGVGDVIYETIAPLYTDNGTVLYAGRSAFMAGWQRHTGLLFSSVNVPQGETINTATITIYIATVGGTPDFTIRANDVDSAGAWADSAGNRPGDMGAETTASTSPAIGGTGQVSFDVKAIIQEIVDRGGWVANNNIRFQFKNNAASGSNNISFESYETGSPTYGPAQLDVDYGDYIMPQVAPHSAYAVTTPRVFPNVHVSDGANSIHEEGLGVEASLGGDAIWRLRFMMPETLPTGTPKLKLWGICDTASQVAKVDPKWVTIDVDGDPSGTAPASEGVNTVTWGAGDNDKYQEVKVTLDADTPSAITAGTMVIMDLTFLQADWTLSEVSTWFPWIIWE